MVSSMDQIKVFVAYLTHGDLFIWDPDGGRVTQFVLIFVPGIKNFQMVLYRLKQFETKCAEFLDLKNCRINLSRLKLCFHLMPKEMISEDYKFLSR